jgi:hypothetical protein
VFLETQTIFLWVSLTTHLENADHPMLLMDLLMVAAALHHNPLMVTLPQRV